MLTPSQPPKTFKISPKDTSFTGKSEWNWRSLTESSITDRPPVFTPDCQYFFLISGSSVKIFSSRTGQIVSTLSSSGSASSSSSLATGDSHSDDITAAIISPRNAFQLVTASLDGRIKVWDYLEAVLLLTIEIGEPITHLCIHQNIPDYLFVATNRHKIWKKTAILDGGRMAQSKVYRVSYKATKSTENAPIKRPMEKIKIGKMRVTTGMGISSSGEWLVAIGGAKAYVSSTASMGGGFTKFISNEPLTCLAFHPTEDYFATGDQRGQIRLWYCLDPALMGSKGEGEEERHAQTTTLHWHAHTVSSIAFSGNGAYLLSGGEEAVLVIWQVHSGKREYIPRVGAPILSVAVATHQSAEEEFLLVLTDGTLAFIGSGSLRITRSFARVKHDAHLWLSGPAPLAVHTLTSTVILPSSHPSSLLTYAPLTSTLVSEIEVSPTNRISRRDEKPIESSRVENVVISTDGVWLATVDGREGDNDFERESYLKIWQWDSSSSAWNLNSRIDRPHGVYKITALCFANSSEHPLLLSAGEDGNVKVWRIKTISSQKGEKEVFWVCRSTLGYRSLIPTTAVCSPDGSLYVVAFGETVVVYEMTTNTLLTTLTTPETRQVYKLAFIGRSGRYLAVSGRRAVVVWDLLTSSTRWYVVIPGSINHLVSHPKDNTFIVIFRGDKNPSGVWKFNVSSSFTEARKSLPFRVKKVVWYPFASAGSSFSLVGITEAWNSVLFGDDIIALEDETLPKSISKNSEPQRRNLFQDIFGVSSLDSTLMKAAPTVEITEETLSASILKSSKILNSPAYLLPPVHTFYDLIIGDLLRHRPERKRPKANPVNMEAEEGNVVIEDAELAIPDVKRVFSEEEMSDFVTLFRDQSFASPKPTMSHKHSNGNGVAKPVVNDIHRNGSSHTKRHLHLNGKNNTGKSNAQSQKDDDPPDLSSAVIGTKRKKNMV